jgi:hypothetical protein
MAVQVKTPLLTTTTDGCWVFWMCSVTNSIMVKVLHKEIYKYKRISYSRGQWFPISHKDKSISPTCYLTCFGWVQHVLVPPKRNQMQWQHGIL